MDFTNNNLKSGIERVFGLNLEWERGDLPNPNLRGLHGYLDMAGLKLTKLMCRV